MEEPGTVHGVAKSQARLSDFTFTFHFPALKKEMATHSSVLAWRIPGTGGPGGLPSMGSHRVGHDWSDLGAAAAGALLSTLSIVPHFPLLRAPWNRSYFTIFMEKDAEHSQGSDSKWQSQAYPSCASHTILCFTLGIRLTESSPYSVSRIWKPLV